MVKNDKIKHMFKVLVLTLIATQVILTSVAWAQDYSRPLLNDEVVIESTQDILQPYRKRRSTLGAIFSLNYENYDPVDYKSLILDKKFSDFGEGESIPLYGAEIGIKYNFRLGSISAVVGYSKGEFSNIVQNLDLISVDVAKIALNYTMDSLMSEPWIAPYIQGGIHQISWSEESTIGGNTQIESFYTDPNFHLKTGVLVQLNWIENWIDPTTAYEGLRTSGLQNTFVDIFYSYYMQPPEVAEVAGEKGEADVSSANFGVGLKLEF